jgi:hypothetical protein
VDGPAAADSGGVARGRAGRIRETSLGLMIVLEGFDGRFPVLKRRVPLVWIFGRHMPAKQTSYWTVEAEEQ